MPQQLRTLHMHARLEARCLAAGFQTAAALPALTQVLLEELAKLMRYKPSLESFPLRISLEEEMTQHLADPQTMKPRLEE